MAVIHTRRNAAHGSGRPAVLREHRKSIRCSRGRLGHSRPRLAEKMHGGILSCAPAGRTLERFGCGGRVMSGFYDIEVKGIDGSADLLGKLRGKIALVVNVASRCGLTPQYDGLELLQKELQDRNFTVIGFPCNQFGAQEPGTEKQIVEFCRTTFDVTFPMSAK